MDFKKNLDYIPHLKPLNEIIDFITDTLVFTEIELPLGWHEHTEIIRILEGDGEFIVSGKVFRVRAGSYIIINPNQIHSAHSNIGRPLKYQSLKFKYNYFESDVTDTIYSTYIEPLEIGESFLPSTILNSFPIHSKISALFDEIDDVLSQKKIGYEILLKMFMYQILYIFYNNKFVYHKKLSNSSKKTSDELVKSTINYIHARYYEDFTLNLLASTFETTKQHLCRTFKRVTNQTITEYQNNHRIKKACELLINSKDTIIKIAFDLGYSNISYFHARFKLKTQLTPKEYRDIYKKG